MRVRDPAASHGFRVFFMSKAQGEGIHFLRRAGKYTLHIHRNGRVDFVPGKPSDEDIAESKMRARQMSFAITNSLKDGSGEEGAKEFRRVRDVHSRIVRGNDQLRKTLNNLRHIHRQAVHRARLLNFSGLKLR